MASKYLINAGGNWTANTSWSTTDAGALINVNDTTAPTASDDVLLTANSGQCTISATSVGKSLTCTGYTNTLTHGAFLLTISGSVTLVSGMTYTPTSTTNLLLNINATGTLNTGGKLLQNLGTASGVTTTLGSNVDFTATKTAFIQVGGSSAGTINMGGFSINGNSAVNRVLIRGGNAIGVTGNITSATNAFTNADFRDISANTGIDVSAVSGLSGDCGGNTNITFTTAATQTYTGGTDSWSTAAKWTSRVPLPQDNVLMSGVTGGTITADMPRLGKSIDWTGASGTPTWVLTSTNVTSYGSVTLISAMNLTTSSANSYTLEGRGAFTITTAGKDFGNSNVVSMVGGTLTFGDAFNSTGSPAIQLTHGTLSNSGNYSITLTKFNSSNSTTRAIVMGDATWTLTGQDSGVLVWTTATTTGLTFTANNSTILFTSVSTTAKTLSGGGLTFNNFHATGGGTGAVIIVGSNSFLNIRVTGGTKSITLPGSTTTTIRGGSGGFSNANSLVTITASSGSATVSKPSGTFRGDYLSLTNIISTGGASFYAGPLTHSTDGGGNTGWIFTSAPGGQGGASSTTSTFAPLMFIM